MADFEPAMVDGVPSGAALRTAGPTPAGVAHLAGPDPAPGPDAHAAPVVLQPRPRPPVSHQPGEAGWWLGTDGLWYPPESVPSAPAVTATAAAAVQPSPRAVPAGPPKSKVVAGLLGIVLGVVGAHRFYLGNTKGGLALLLATVLSAGFLAPIVALCGIIEGVLILCGARKTDARGIALR